LKVIDNDVCQQQAIWACCLGETVTKQKLLYHVKKEKARKRVLLEKAEALKWTKEGMTIVFDGDVTLRTEVSPLTQATLASPNLASTPSPFFHKGQAAADCNSNNDNNNIIIIMPGVATGGSSATTTKTITKKK
jgi:hypothetical protein